jgi:hypothetical protein
MAGAMEGDTFIGSKAEVCGVHEYLSIPPLHAPSKAV